jgi:hypothetical protein
VIIPARYLNQADARLLAKHAMEDIDAEFAARVKPGDVIDLLGQKYTSHINCCDFFFVVQEMEKSSYSAL